MRRETRDTAAFCLGLLLVGALIQLAGWLKGDALVFPGVPEILRAFFRLISSGHTWRLIGTTLKHLAVSMAAATLIGVAVGAVEGVSDFARALLRPLMILLRAIPMVVLAVIVMVLSPYRRVPVIVSTLILIPVVSEAVSEGIRHIDPALTDVWRLNGGFGPRVLLSVHLPLIAGYMKQAYVNAVGTGIKLAVAAEYLVQTRDSLGKAIYSSSYFNEYADIYAYALVMVLLVLAAGALPGWIARALDRKKRGENNGR